MADMQSLSQQLALLARPGIAVATSDGALTIDVSSPHHPDQQILGYTLTPLGDGWQNDSARAIQGLAEFMELISSILHNTPRSRLAPLPISGQIFNKGFMLNSHDVGSLFNLQLRFIEEDRTRWGAPPK